MLTLINLIDEETLVNALFSLLQKLIDRGVDSTSPRTRVESFSKVNNQGGQGGSFVPDVLGEPQFNGPAQLMETIVIAAEGQANSKYGRVTRLHFFEII